MLSPRAREYWPFSVECKSLQQASVYKYIDQAEANCKGHCPMVVLKANRREPLAIVPFTKLIDLMSGDGDEG